MSTTLILEQNDHWISLARQHHILREVTNGTLLCTVCNLYDLYCLMAQTIKFNYTVTKSDKISDSIKLPAVAMTWTASTVIIVSQTNNFPVSNSVHEQFAIVQKMCSRGVHHYGGPRHWLLRFILDSMATLFVDKINNQHTGRHALLERVFSYLSGKLVFSPDNGTVCTIADASYALHAQITKWVPPSIWQLWCCPETPRRSRANVTCDILTLCR